MILSIHIPKTGGQSFGQYLRHAFGTRVLFDYDDWPESTSEDATAHNQANYATAASRADEIDREFDIIQGHFLATKYHRIYPEASMISFLRDPYQQSISTYHHAVRVAATSNTGHPGMSLFREKRMTLLDFVEAFPNHQALYLSGVPLEALTMVGITEDYDRSIALFEKIFDVTGPEKMARVNVNPLKASDSYPVPADVRAAVDRHRAQDVELYRRAQDHFRTLTTRYGV